MSEQWAVGSEQCAARRSWASAVMRLCGGCAVAAPPHPSGYDN